MTLTELLDEYEYAASHGMDTRHEFRAKIDAVIMALLKSRDYIYIGIDGKPVQARDLEDQLLAVREENAKLLKNAKLDADMLLAYSKWCGLNNCAPNSSDLIRMMK